MSIENRENINEKIREIYLKQEFFEFVKSGLKTLEARVAFQSFLNISEGDHVIFKSGQGESVKVEITGVRQYNNLNEVLQAENISKLAPNMIDEQIQKIGQALFSKSDIEKYGLLIFEFQIARAP